jgi:beta-lactamase class A
MLNLEPILEQAKGKLIAVAFQDLETDTDYYLNADQEFHPASTFKVHVMMEVFRQANEGLLSLQERLTTPSKPCIRAAEKQSPSES